MSRLHLVISGRVQGVYYRASMQEVANDLKVTGWVKNLANGSVEAEVQGDASQLEKMLTWCRKGPKFSQIDDIEIIERADIADQDKFEIRY